MLSDVAHDLCIACYPNDPGKQHEMLTQLALPPGDELEEVSIAGLRAYYEEIGVWPEITGDRLKILMEELACTSKPINA